MCGELVNEEDVISYWKFVTKDRGEFMSKNVKGENRGEYMNVAPLQILI